MRKKIWIYKITNIITNRFYIGQTNDISKRKSAHSLVKDEGTFISNSIVKHGWDNHIFEILFHDTNVSIEIANQIEIYYIGFYGGCQPFNKLSMNLNNGGMQGIQTKEQLRRMVETKFTSYKKKIEKAGLAIEVYDSKSGELLIKHYGIPRDLLIIMSMEPTYINIRALNRTLVTNGSVFRKKYIVQWEGENRVEKYKKYIAGRIRMLSETPLTEKRLNALKGSNRPNQKIPILDLRNGIYHNSITEFAELEGVSKNSVCVRFKKGKYIGKYLLSKTA